MELRLLFTPAKSNKLSWGRNNHCGRRFTELCCTLWSTTTASCHILHPSKFNSKKNGGNWHSPESFPVQGTCLNFHWQIQYRHSLPAAQKNYSLKRLPGSSKHSVSLYVLTIQQWKQSKKLYFMHFLPSPNSFWWICFSAIGSKSLVIMMRVCWPAG